MLPGDSADLIRRDRAIPGLATVLRGDELVGAMQTRLPAAGLIGAQLSYARYKPGVSCLAVHRLATADGDLEVYGKAFGRGCAVKLAKARRRSGIPGPLGEGSLVFEDELVVVSSFPNDLKLATLRVLGSPRKREHLLRRVLGDGSALSRGVLSRLAYKPERRYVAKLEYPHREARVLKFYDAAGFERACRAHAVLSSHGTCRLPRKVGRSRRHRVLALQWLPGRSLRSVIRDPGPATEEAAAAGEALASFHAQDAGGLAIRQRDDEAATLRAVAEGLAVLLPGIAARAKGLADALGDWLMARPSPSAPIHGDFYDKQVVVGSDGAGLIDLDEAAVGDPFADLGLFVAHLQRDAIRGDIGPRRATAVSKALLAGYLGSGARVSDDLRKYIASGLLQLAHHPFRTGAPDWARRTERIVRRAESWAWGSATDEADRWITEE